MTQKVFERTEKKYRLTAAQRDYINKALADKMQPDCYGLTTICSIYFDTAQNELIRRSISKPVFKEKFRLRSYGVPSQDSTVFLELKKKFKGTVYKRRVAMSYREAMIYFERGELPNLCVSDAQNMREIDWTIGFYSLTPKVFIGCERIALYSSENPSLRITFDENIRARSTELLLGCGADGELILPQSESLMEIKTSDAMPLWLCDILTNGHIYPTGFSKYGTYYLDRVTKEEKGKCFQAFSNLQEAN